MPKRTRRQFTDDYFPAHPIEHEGWDNSSASGMVSHKGPAGTNLLCRLGKLHRYVVSPCERYGQRAYDYVFIGEEHDLAGHDSGGSGHALAVGPRRRARCPRRCSLPQAPDLRCYCAARR